MTSKNRRYSLDEHASSTRRFGLIPVMLAVSLFIVCFDNNQFWWTVANTVNGAEHPRILSLLMFLLLLGGINVTLALSIGQRGFKATAAALLLLASAVGFYMSKFGIAIDTSLVRSALETDLHKVSALLTLDFLVHVALFGALPALIVLFLPMKRCSWKRDLAAKGALIALSILGPVIAIHADYLEFSFYGQANRHVRLFMNPLYPAYATGQYFRELLQSHFKASNALATGSARPLRPEPPEPVAVVTAGRDGRP